MADQITINVTENKQITVENVLDSLKTTDAAPTTVGLYRLSEVGTYTNLGGLVTTAGKINDAYFDGTTWKLIAVEIPNFVATHRDYPLPDFKAVTELYIGAGFDKTKVYKVNLMRFIGADSPIIRLYDENNVELFFILNPDLDENGVYHGVKNGYEIWWVNPTQEPIDGENYIINNDFAFYLENNALISKKLNRSLKYTFNEYTLYGNGDSITHGFNDEIGTVANTNGGELKKGYLERFYYKAKCKAFVKNAHTGSSCKYAPPRYTLFEQINKIPINSEKKIITVMIGTNDIIEGFDLLPNFTNDMNNLDALFSKNLNQVSNQNSLVEAFYYCMLLLLKNHKGQKIFVIEAPNWAVSMSRLENVRNMQKKICKFLGIPYIEIDAWMTTAENNNDGFTTNDSLHPNPDIHELMSESLFAKLSPYFTNNF